LEMTINALRMTSMHGMSCNELSCMDVFFPFLMIHLAYLAYIAFVYGHVNLISTIN